jgi:hypothetical protein
MPSDIEMALQMVIDIPRNVRHRTRPEQAGEMLDG